MNWSRYNNNLRYFKQIQMRTLKLVTGPILSLRKSRLTRTGWNILDNSKAAKNYFIQNYILVEKKQEFKNLKILSFDSKTLYWSLTLIIHWWQNFHSRWRSFWVIANQKFEKFGREDILCPRAIFSVYFFNLFSSPIYLYRLYLEALFDLSRFIK